MAQDEHGQDGLDAKETARSLESQANVAPEVDEQ